jgi:phospholipid/cholesterol/gamma-HCH transport system substrate-binding protein
MQALADLRARSCYSKDQAMAEWTRGAKVGAFAIVLLGATVAIYSYVGKSRFGPRGLTLHATMRDATGLAPLSRINMAGIPVGRIKGIRVTPEGRARVDIEIDPGIKLHKDASLAKQSATLLSEPYLGVTPGADNVPFMVDGDEVTNVIEPVTTDDILQRVGDIATNVQAVTKSLRNTVGNDEGERQMQAILRNVEQATSALNMIAQENRLSLRRTLKNVEDITENAKPKAAKILDSADEATARLNAIVGENRTDIRTTVKSTRETMEKASRATSTLDSALGHVDSIAARIDRGEGTIGKLTKDEALIDEVQGAAEGINDFVGGISRLQTIVGLHSEYYFLSNSIKNYLEVRLQPREDKYYMIELVSDPRGRTTITQTDVDTTNPNQPAHYREIKTETTNALRFSLQFARRLGPFTGRFGIKESTGGIGLITHLFDDRFELQQDLFGFGEQLIPRWRVAFTYEFIKRLWLIGGVDNLLTRERRDYYVGLNLRFTDEDLKSVLFFAPKTN